MLHNFNTLICLAVLTSYCSNEQKLNKREYATTNASFSSEANQNQITEDKPTLEDTDDLDAGKDDAKEPTDSIEQGSTPPNSPEVQTEPPKKQDPPEVSGPRPTFIYVANKDRSAITTFQINQENRTLDFKSDTGSEMLGKPETITAANGILYASTDKADSNEKYWLYAYRINRDSGELEYINHIEYTHRSLYLSVYASGKYLVSADYFIHETAAIRLDSDTGALIAESDRIITGKNPHSAVFDNAQKFIYVPSKISNTIMQLSLNFENGKFTKINENTVNVTEHNIEKPWPRHIKFHPTLKIAYVNNENDVSISIYSIGTDGKLTHNNTVNSYPGRPMNADLNSSELLLSNEGRYLYIAHRDKGGTGEDAISQFSVDEETGDLTFIKSTPTQHFPRSMTLSKDGKYLIAAGEKSHSLELYLIDAENGQLESKNVVNKRLQTPYCIITY